MPGPKSDKPWADAVRKAVNDIYEEKDEDGILQKRKYLNRLAANLVAKALSGDVQALKEIGDRLDGKPKQSIDSDVEQTLHIIIDDPTKEN